MVEGIMRKSELKEITNIMNSYTELTSRCIEIHRHMQEDHEEVELARELRKKARTIQRIHNSFNVLNEKENEVIELLYIKRYTERSIANMMFVTESRISQIKHNALTKMKKYIC